ncbi:MAG: ATP-binding protein [Marmoricola sp.]
MPTGPATAVTVSIARDPALVRTVRLIAAAVARRSGGDEEFVEEVRLAVGEACALLVGEQSGHSSEPVTVVMALGEQLRVDVESHAGIVLADPADGIEPWALLRGLIDDFHIEQNSSATTVSMSWPAGPSV